MLPLPELRRWRSLLLLLVWLETILQTVPRQKRGFRRFSESDGENLGRRDFGSFAKVPVILDDPVGSHGLTGKAPTVLDRFMSYQLVGGVTAHQGGDG